jgi:hypothetical protein
MKDTTNDWVMEKHGWLLEVTGMYRQTFLVFEGPSRGTFGYCFNHRFCHLNKSHDIVPDSRHPNRHRLSRLRLGMLEDSLFGRGWTRNMTGWSP